MTDSRTPSDLIKEAIGDLRTALEDLEHDHFCVICPENPDTWDAARDLVQGAAGLLSDAAKMKRENSKPGGGKE